MIFLHYTNNIIRIRCSFADFVGGCFIVYALSMPWVLQATHYYANGLPRMHFWCLHFTCFCRQVKCSKCSKSQILPNTFSFAGDETHLASPDDLFTLHKQHHQNPVQFCWFCGWVLHCICIKHALGASSNPLLCKWFAPDAFLVLAFYMFLPASEMLKMLVL